MSIIPKIKVYLLCAVALVSVSVSAEEIQFEGVRYDINKKTKQAQVLKISNEESGSLISIPKFVEHLGELYLVTSVSNNAFANRNLSCISIPSCVTMVGKRAFADCTNLEKIFCFATTPPSFKDGCFPKRKMQTLFVPYSCSNVYKESKWSEHFVEIKEMQEKTSFMAEDREDKDRVFDVVDENASFPGGDEACMNWLFSNLEYPDSCQLKGIEGRVIVSFVVNRDGSITEIKAVRSPHELLSKEAIRVVNSMPKWKPANVKGKNVRSRFNLPIMFRLR